MSVKELTNARTFDEFGHPIAGGLHDLALGPADEGNGVPCVTCHRTGVDCPGHVGHIRLAAPCMNPTFFQTTIMVGVPSVDRRRCSCCAAPVSTAVD